MKFTIESFKTSIYRPAEWMFQNETIQHLVSDLNKQYDGTLSFAYGIDNSGDMFYIEVYKHIDNDTLSKDYGNVLEVKFLTKDRVSFEEKFEQLIKRPPETEKATIYYMPYWTCVSIMKKLSQTVFKVLTTMQDYPPLSSENDNGVQKMPIPGNKN